MSKKDIAHAIKIAMLRGEIKVEGFDISSEILREARDKSKQKNTVLFGLFDPKFQEPGMNILVRLNAGKDKESRKVRVAQREVKVGVDRHDIPQVHIIGDVIDGDNRIIDKVSLGYGTEMIDFISASK